MGEPWGSILKPGLDTPSSLDDGFSSGSSGGGKVSPSRCLVLKISLNARRVFRPQAGWPDGIPGCWGHSSGRVPLRLFHLMAWAQCSGLFFRLESYAKKGFITPVSDTLDPTTAPILQTYARFPSVDVMTSLNIYDICFNICVSILI